MKKEKKKVKGFRKVLKIATITLVVMLCLIIGLVGVAAGFLYSFYSFMKNDFSYDEANFYHGDTTIYAESQAGSHWTLGFAKSVITPDDLLDNPEKYYLAGYFNNIRPTEIFDDIYVRVIYLDDNTGRGGAIFAALDVIGLSNKDILRIREQVRSFAQEKGFKAINISSTHNHGGIDTQGLWGDPFKLKTGRNEEYQEFVIARTAQAIMDAYEARQDGKLFWGEISPENVFNDNRTPIVYDESITRITFVPQGETEPSLYIVNAGIHPENMAAGNTSVSADFPCYMGRYIAEETGADFIWFTGAIGTLINAYGLEDVFDEVRELKNDTTMSEDDRNALDRAIRKEFTQSYGEMIGEYVLDIVDTEEIIPLLNIKINKVLVPVENFILIVGAKAGLINTNLAKNPDKKGAKFAVPTEVGMVRLGNSITIALAPGELAPEFALGGFLSSDESGNGYAMDITPLYQSMGATKNIVFGLTNDQIGYIIPDNDYVIHKTLPYVNWAKIGEKEYYEETVSTGKYTGRILVKEWEEILASLNN